MCSTSRQRTASIGCVPSKVDTAWWLGEQLYYCNNFYFRKDNEAFVKAWEQGWEVKLFTPGDMLNNKGAWGIVTRCFQTLPRAEMRCWECLALGHDRFSLEVCDHMQGNLEVRRGDAIPSLPEWMCPMFCNLSTRTKPELLSLASKYIYCKQQKNISWVGIVGVALEDRAWRLSWLQLTLIIESWNGLGWKGP